MQFPYTWRTEHFLLYYGYRSPYDALQDPQSFRQPLLPLDGVRDFSYVKMVGSFCDQAWRVFYDLGLSMPDTPFPIYFQHLRTPLDGLMLPWGGKDGSIVVQSQYALPRGLENIPTIQAIVAHELFHAIQERYSLAPGSNVPAAWDWWAEATATFMEGIVFPGTIDYLKFLHTWLDEPSVSLDASEGLSSRGLYHDQGPADHSFGSVLFCRFLYEHFDIELILDTWRQAALYQLPFEALHQLLLSGRYGTPSPLASAQAPDLFSSQFLPTNFFLSDIRYGYQEGALHEHFFQHAFVSRVFEGPMSAPHLGILDHLAAAYFLIRPAPSSLNESLTILLKCSVDSVESPMTSPIKGVFIPMTMRHSARDGIDIYLEPSGPGQFTGHYAEANFWRNEIDEALLIVVNPTWGENTWNDVQYEFEIGVQPLEMQRFSRLENVPAPLRQELLPLEKLDDIALQQVAKSTWSPVKHVRYTELLEKERAGTITFQEKAECEVLYQDANDHMLRKAYASALLTQRGYPPEGTL